MKKEPDPSQPHKPQLWMCIDITAGNITLGKMYKNYKSSPLELFSGRCQILALVPVC